MGGTLRDILLKRPIKDLDLVVRNIPLPELITHLKTCGQLSLVGKSFGVIKFRPREAPDMEIDIALPRKEKSTGVGHKDFEIEANENLPLCDDLMRRDFTINALAQNVVTQELIDPTGGQKDLQERTLRTVFDRSFVEDPLRLLRAVQFAARLDFTIAPETLAEMQQHASLITTVAKERVAQEIQKLLSAQKPSQGFDLMAQTGLLPFVLVDIQNTRGVIQPKKENEDVYGHTMRALDAARSATELTKPGDLTIMLAVLFHDVGKPKTYSVSEDGTTSFYNHHLVSAGIARRWLKEYKVTTLGVDIQRVCHLIKNHMFETVHFEKNEKALRRFMNKVGKDNLIDLLDVRLADKKGGRFPNKVYGIVKLRETIMAELAKKPPFTPKDLAINGHDLMAMGFKPGPLLGDIQRFLMQKVIDAPELNIKEELQKMILENFTP